MFTPAIAARPPMVTLSMWPQYGPYHDPRSRGSSPSTCQRTTANPMRRFERRGRAPCDMFAETGRGLPAGNEGQVALTPVSSGKGSSAIGPAGTDPDAPLRIAYLTYRGKPHVGGQ